MKTTWSPPDGGQTGGTGTRRTAGQQGHAVHALGELEPGELVVTAAGEALGDVLLVFGEHVDRVHCRVFEDGTLGRWPDRLQTISGGVRDTELKELTVRPMGSPPGARAVITVTPVGNMPSVSRKARTAGSFLGTVMMESVGPRHRGGPKACRGPHYRRAAAHRRGVKRLNTFAEP
jgi:hypothetical protein